jgi:Do/DeqQ family serine protease
MKDASPTPRSRANLSARAPDGALGRRASTSRALGLSLALLAPVAAAPAAASPPAGGEHGAIATANQLGIAFSAVAEQVSPSVVSIQVEVTRQQRGGFMFQFPFGGQSEPGVQQGSGSGMVLTADGGILTNNHVVEHASRIRVKLQDGRQFTGKVVGVDPATDLAVVKIDAKGLTPVKFADSDAAMVGQWLVAIGSPFGLDYTVTAGVLSAKGRSGLGPNQIEDYLQTDASINPGNSGGPLVNLQGEVLGVNTMIIGHASGIGFAIPSNMARKIGLELLQKGDVSRAYIGVTYQPLTPELASSFGAERTRGALINEAVPDGPAARAGLRSGDIVLEVQGREGRAREVKEANDLQRAILLYSVGDKLTLTILRNGQKQKISVVTAERPDSRQAKAGSVGKQRGGAKAPNSSGMELTQLTPDIARRLGYSGQGGVVVADVAPGSVAEHAGLMRGDIIQEIDRKPVSSEKQVEEALTSGRALLKLHRQGSTFFAVIGE